MAMMTFEQALEIINAAVVPLAAEKIPLKKALNRVLAETVVSDMDMPPFDRAAMDGYACRKEDLGGDLQVIEEVPAGKVPLLDIKPGQCAKIMTGAMVPHGADFILMKEHAGSSGHNRVHRVKTSDSNNIRYRGEDLKSGDSVLQPGTRLSPANLALLAATGYTDPLVYALPEVAIISTGNELTEPENKPENGKIRNSNGYQLTAQAVQYGLTPEYYGIVPDDEQALTEVISTSFSKHSLVLISGGVSVGDYDYVPGILASMDVEIMIHGLRVKPGKHFLMGRSGDHFIGGMPGNPVSSLIMFEVLVKPLLNRLTGMTGKTPSFYVPLENEYVRKTTDTLFFIPVSMTGRGTAVPLEYHGSAHIHSYAKANGIMEVPMGISKISKGEMVYVRPV